MQSLKYLRDGRAPVPISENISKVMSSNRGKDTKPELILRKTLREIGIPGYRLHWKNAPGRPDIVYPGNKIAIFVNGCYWHRCPNCNLPLPKSNIDFWMNKFKKNKIRDKTKKEKLKEAGWKVFVFWECEIKDDVKRCAEKIKNYMKNNQ
jgi:DNA mismatch endonuclease (patch repair protein)